MKDWFKRNAWNLIFLLAWYRYIFAVSFAFLIGVLAYLWIKKADIPAIAIQPVEPGSGQFSQFIFFFGLAIGLYVFYVGFFAVLSSYSGEDWEGK